MRMCEYHANLANMQINEIVYKELSYQINGLLYDVHNELGRYCNEKQISDAIEKKLKERNILHKKESIIPISFPGEQAGRNRVDFIIDDKIILEIKCCRMIGREEYYQCRRYLQAFNKKLCLIANFRDKQLRIKRILNSRAES